MSMYDLFVNFLNLPTVVSSLNSGLRILSVIPLKVDGPFFDFISGFLFIPSIYLGLWVVGGIYFFIKRLSSSLVANIALPLIVTLVFTYNFALLLSITPVGPTNFKYALLLGAIYSIAIHILILRVSDSKKKSKNRNKKAKSSNGSGQKSSNIDTKAEK